MEKLIIYHDFISIELFFLTGVLHRCPSRFAGKELIRSDDDLFILSTAKDLDGVVISRDQYHKYYELYNDYRGVIRDRLIQPTFIGDLFKLPDDPLGKGGPTLDTFLRFDR